jgi:glutathione S-transferase
VDGQARSRAWLAGDSFSLADVAMAPFAERLEHLGLGKLWDGYEAAQEWLRRVLARPSILAARAPQQHRFALAGTQVA